MTTVVDIQCEILVVLASLDATSPPPCLAVSAAEADGNCDGQTDAADVILLITYALSGAPSPAIDLDHNGCPDACQPDGLDCSQVDCDDGNECTLDECDPFAGCTHPPVSCAGKPTCSGDGCKPGDCISKCKQVCASSACPDWDCSGMFCVPVIEVCELCVQVCDSPTMLCQDGDACTTEDHCVAGECVGQPVGCDDGDPCTLDTCDASSGQCSHEVPAKPCDDGNPCTVDTCVSGVGCVFTKGPPGVSCDDGDHCTDHDVCVEGVCVGDPVECDDGDSCTVDTCEPSVGCMHLGYGCLPCDTDADCSSDRFCGAGRCLLRYPNGTPCAAPQQCAGGACVETCSSCSDQADCPPATFCSATAHGCVAKANAGAPCVEDAACASGACIGGFCAACSAASDCPSGQFCDPVAHLCVPKTYQSPPGAWCEGSAPTCTVDGSVLTIAYGSGLSIRLVADSWQADASGSGYQADTTALSVWSAGLYVPIPLVDQGATVTVTCDPVSVQVFGGISALPLLSGSVAGNSSSAYFGALLPGADVSLETNGGTQFSMVSLWGYQLAAGSSTDPIDPCKIYLVFASAFDSGVLAVGTASADIQHPTLVTLIYDPSSLSFLLQFVSSDVTPPLDGVLAHGAIGLSAEMAFPPTPQVPALWSAEGWQSYEPPPGGSAFLDVRGPMSLGTNLMLDGTARFWMQSLDPAPIGNVASGATEAMTNLLEQAVLISNVPTGEPHAPIDVAGAAQASPSLVGLVDLDDPIWSIGPIRFHLQTGTALIAEGAIHFTAQAPDGIDLELVDAEFDASPSESLFEAYLGLGALLGSDALTPGHELVGFVDYEPYHFNLVFTADLAFGPCSLHDVPIAIDSDKGLQILADLSPTHVDAGGAMLDSACDVGRWLSAALAGALPCTGDGDCQGATFCDATLGLCVPTRGSGAPCLGGTQCASGLCLGGLCTACTSHSDCLAGQWCDNVVGCLDKKEGGWPCLQDPAICQSGICQSNELCAGCVDDADCQADEFCKTTNQGFAICTAKLSNGQGPCDTDASCLSGICLGGKCAECSPDKPCDPGKLCVALPGGGASCLNADGQPCQADAECSSGNCFKGTCVECLADDQCPSGQFCFLSSGGYACHPYLSNGEEGCVKDSHCLSGHCLLGRCVECVQSYDCPSSKVCVSFGGTNQCLKPCKKPFIFGSSCLDPDPCTSDKCVKLGVYVCVHIPISCSDGNPCTDDTCVHNVGCQSVPRPDSAPCDDGDPCTVLDACAANTCAGVPVSCDDGNPCTLDTCDDSGGCVHVAAACPCTSEGDCTTPNTYCSNGNCTVKLPNGSPCSSPQQCTSGLCVGNCSDCATDADCPAGTVCSLGAGSCVPLADDGEPCQYDAACKSGQCVQGICAMCTTDGDCPQGQECDRASQLCTPIAYEPPGSVTCPSQLDPAPSACTLDGDVLTIEYSQGKTLSLQADQWVTTDGGASYTASSLVVTVLAGGVAVPIPLAAASSSLSVQCNPLAIEVTSGVSELPFLGDAAGDLVPLTFPVLNGSVWDFQTDQPPNISMGSKWGHQLLADGVAGPIDPCKLYLHFALNPDNVGLVLGNSTVGFVDPLDVTFLYDPEDPAIYLGLKSSVLGAVTQGIFHNGGIGLSKNGTLPLDMKVPKFWGPNGWFTYTPPQGAHLFVEYKGGFALAGELGFAADTRLWAGFGSIDGAAALGDLLESLVAASAPVVADGQPAVDLQTLAQGMNGGFLLFDLNNFTFEIGPLGLSVGAGAGVLDGGTAYFVGRVGPSLDIDLSSSGGGGSAWEAVSKAFVVLQRLMELGRIQPREKFMGFVQYDPFRFNVSFSADVQWGPCMLSGAILSIDSKEGFLIDGEAPSVETVIDGKATTVDCDFSEWIAQVVAGAKSCDSDGDCDSGQYCDAVLQLCRALKGNGTPCVSGSECASGSCPAFVCIDCQSPADCAGDEFCDGLAGCLKKLPNGVPCFGHDEMCMSGICGSMGNCVACLSDADCASDEFCWFETVGQGICSTPLANGVPCQSDSQCKSGHCTLGFCAQCATDADCSPDEYCLLSTIGGTGCVSKADNGVPCTKDAACKSGHCSLGLCAECASDADCGPGEFCPLKSVGGSACLTKFGAGAPCAGDNNCKSGICKWGLCKECSTSAQCGSGKLCVGLACVPDLLGLGSVCFSDSKCASGKCCGTCVASGKKCVGQSCYWDSECASGKCRGVHSCNCQGCCVFGVCGCDCDTCAGACSPF